MTIKLMIEESQLCFITSIKTSKLHLSSTQVPSLATSCPHASQKHVLLANQNSKFWQSNFKVYPPTLELFGATPQTFTGKQSQSAMRSGILGLEFWKSKGMKCLFLIWMPIQLTTEKQWLTFCHSAGANCVISFMTFLILQGWSVFPSAKAASYCGWGFFKFFSFYVCFVMFRVFLLLFLYEPFTSAKQFIPACRRRNVACFLAVLNVYSFRYSMLRPFVPDVETFFCAEISNLIRALHVTAMLTLFDASLLFTLRCFYRKIMFKTGLLWPLDFRVDSEPEKMKIFCQIPRRQCCKRSQ